MEKKNYGTVFAVIFAILVVVVGIWGLAANAKTQDKLLEKQGLLDSQSTTLTEQGITIANLTNEIANLQIIASETPEVPNIPVEEGYLLDGIFLGDFINKLNKVFSDRELPKLIDSKVEVNDKSYDYEEILNLNGTLAINKEDYKEDAYLNLLDNDVSYKVVFEDDLSEVDWSDEDNTLTFNFLGSEITITKWDNLSNEITLFKGDVYYLEEGVAQTINGKEVELVFANDESALIRVGDSSREVVEGQTKTIGGLQVKIDYVFETTNFRVGQAKVIVGEDVEETIVNGDEYEEDSIWEYVITDNSIGITLNEKFTDIDADEEYKAIAKDGKFCLPNDYICIRYNGLVEEDYENYRFYLDDEFVVAKGKFQSGLGDYDKVFIALNGTIYDNEDKDNALTNVRFGDSDKELTADGTRIYTNTGVNFKYNTTGLYDLIVNSVVVDDKEDNYRSQYGTVVLSPESNLDDNEVELSIPMEEAEASVTIL